jgi:hypothetical protein
MADAADKLVTPWECTGEDCGVSAVTATEMVNKFGHYVTAENPDVFTFFETCGACNNDVVGIRCVDCPESADTHEEAEIKFGEDYADKERQVRKGNGTGLRCRKCMEKFDKKEKSKKKKPVPEPKKKNAKKDGTKRELDVPTASSDSDDEGDSKSGKADKSPKRNKAQSPSPSPSSAKKAATKSTTRKRASKKK